MPRLHLMIISAWKLFAVLVFALNLIAHITTYFEIDPGVTVMILMLLPLVPLLTASHFYAKRAIADHSRQVLALSNFPPWILGIMSLFFLYAFLQIALAIMNSEGTRPARTPDGQIWIDTQAVVRSRINQLRASSSVFMFFAAGSLALLHVASNANRDSTN